MPPGAIDDAAQEAAKDASVSPEGKGKERAVSVHSGASTARHRAAVSFLANIPLMLRPSPRPRPAPLSTLASSAANEPPAATASTAASAETPATATTAATSSARAFSDREAAALSFLSSIPVRQNDTSAGADAATAAATTTPVLSSPGSDTDSDEDDKSLNRLGSSYTDDVPALSRKKSLSGELGFRNPTFIFTTKLGAPFALFTVIPYPDGKHHHGHHHHHQRKKKNSAGSINVSENIFGERSSKKRKAESFGRLLESKGTLEPLPPDNPGYNPYFLDDPILTTGKNKTVITLPSFISSIIHYTRPSDLKKELNDHFRVAHPNIDLNLTLSQIRNLKARIISVAMKMDLELSSVAKAFVYFEKLVIKNVVVKENRRLIASVCLLLATKVNDPKDFDHSALIDELEETCEVGRKQVLEAEFPVFAALEFSLYVPPWEYGPHLERIFAALDYNTMDEYYKNQVFFQAR